MEKFAENPFAALDKKQFRDGGKVRPPQGQGKKKNDRARHTPHDAASQSAVEDAEDARLFLHAVQQVEQKEAKKKSGFPLHEQQSFSQLTGKGRDSRLDEEESAAFRAAMRGGAGKQSPQRTHAQGAPDKQARPEPCAGKGNSPDVLSDVGPDGRNGWQAQSLRPDRQKPLRGQDKTGGSAPLRPTLSGSGGMRYAAAVAAGERASAEAAAMPAGAAQESMEDAMDALESLVLAEADSDVAAFTAAMRQVAPLAGKGRAVAPQPVTGTPPPGGELGMQDVMDGKLEFALSLTGEYLEGYVVGLDEATMNKLRAGTFSPEAHLDLHGLNAMQAFQALLGFMRQSWYKGLRTVLVVPGRGLNSPNGYGILRDRLQLWLTQEPFKRVVLAFCTAVPADGGPGSIYVMLRKYRKKGRIYWERMPTDPDLV